MDYFSKVYGFIFENDIRIIYYEFQGVFRIIFKLNIKK